MPTLGPDPARPETRHQPWHRTAIIGDITPGEITARWGRWYTIEADGAGYRAVRADGKTGPGADTLAGLESAIRADYWRWTRR